MSAEFLNELRKIPPVTRFLCISTLVVTIPTLLELVSVYPILFVRHLVVQKFEVWRIPLSFFLGGKGIGFIFDMMMLYRNSDGLESVQYSRRSYDFAWQLFLSACAILAINLPLNSYVHFRPLLVCLVYLSCAIDPNSIVSLFGLVRLPAKYFPYVMVGMDILSGAGMRAALSSFTGIIVGHAWWILEHQHPTQGGTQFGRAPVWVKQLVGDGAGGTQTTQTPDARSFGAAAAPRGRSLNDGGRPAQAQGQATGYQWGAGQRLGS